jgi:hypothetical protein
MSLAGTMVEASPSCPLFVPSSLTATTCGRSFRLILLIPSWEGLSADPEEKRGPCDRHHHWIDGESLKALDNNPPQ